MEQLIPLFAKLGVKVVLSENPEKVTIKGKQYHKWFLNFPAKSAVEFVHRVGYRYCDEKSMKAQVAAAYTQHCLYLEKNVEDLYKIAGDKYDELLQAERIKLGGSVEPNTLVRGVVGRQAVDHVEHQVYVVQERAKLNMALASITTLQLSWRRKLLRQKEGQYRKGRTENGVILNPSLLMNANDFLRQVGAEAWFSRSSDVPTDGNECASELNRETQPEASKRAKLHDMKATSVEPVAAAAASDALVKLPIIDDILDTSTFSDSDAPCTQTIQKEDTEAASATSSSQERIRKRKYTAARDAVVLPVIHLRVARVRVLSTAPIAVYDITIDQETPYFLANGVCVHNCELNIDEKATQHYFTVHCGSRSFGKFICDFHQKRIYDAKTFDRHAFQQAKKQLKQLRKSNHAAYDVAVSKLEQKICDDKHPPYLEGQEAYEYFFDMIFAQHYAQLNRDLILRRVHTGLKQWCLDQSTPVVLEDFDAASKIESIHNTIDFRDFIIRKGAIGARRDELCLVALNMKDGMLLCRGKGNDEWNQSCAHGCGRIMSREAAMKRLSVSAYISTMEGVFTTNDPQGTLDEAPQAYKDSDLIRRTIAHTVDILEQLRTVLNIKANSS